jgi:RimJ/RimL family protein N-acetyltransferase
MHSAQRATPRSARLRKEGLARAYLKIDGAWADHVLTSRINPRD